MNGFPTLRLPAGLDRRRFLRECWQKRARLLPQAIPSFTPPLSADEIAGLACEPDIESRLVFTDRAGSSVRYRVEPGPFSPARLASLPGGDWTLLVHDLDRHLPELRPLLFAVDLVPAWRLGDLMVSVAAPGGSVGPHRDSYDVFLLQGTGERRWQIGDGVPRRDDSGLRLLDRFTPSEDWCCRRGDCVYVPPGTGHHGVALTLCTTWSLGLQAPLISDLAAYLDLDIGRIDDDLRYEDPDLEPAEVCGGLIAPASIRRCRERLPDCPRVTDEEIAEAFGRLLTLPGPGQRPEPVTASVANGLVEAARSGTRLRPCGPAARFQCDDGGLVFIAGEAVAVKADAWPLAVRISDPEAGAGIDLVAVCEGESERLVETLCRYGLLETAFP